MRSNVKNLFVLVLSLFQFHSIMPQACNTVFYDGVFYSVTLDRCRCFCIRDSDIAIQLAELLIVSILDGTEGKCEFVDDKDPCTWWTAGSSTDVEIITDTNRTNSTWI